VSFADLPALMPILLMAVTAVVVMLGIGVRRSHTASVALSLTGLSAALASLPIAAANSPRRVAELLIMDDYSVFFTGLIILSTVVVTLLSHRYLEMHDVRREELYVLLLLAAAGSAVLVAANHFVSFFLGLELLSVSLYALTAYLHQRKSSLEAGTKYLVLAASSTAFLLFGMALVYAQLGTMSFEQMAGQSRAMITADPVLLAGVALILTGFGFKLGLVPFHLWTPDVYEGAPAPVTALVASVSKGAVFALLLRYLYRSGAQLFEPVSLAITVLAIASMCAGNLLALLQDNVKRILAYSSIAHMGYVLVALQASGEFGPQAVAFYLVAYTVTTLGAFGVVTVLSAGDRDADRIEDYRGLFWRRPALAIGFTVMMLSLAGIPLTAGFLGKFYIVVAGASSAIWVLVLTLVVTSVIGLYYYLRVIVAVYSPGGPAPTGRRVSVPDGVVLTTLTILLLWLGVYPGPFLDMIRSAVAGF
jgi:NADH-quinone oxidoreductase subunit N